MSHRTPLLSIVVPVKNRGRYLGSVLATVVGQEFSDFEVLVMENGSDDETVKVVHGLGDRRVRVLPADKPLGMSENWERGLDFASGRYVFYLGGDDGVVPGALREIAHLLERFQPPSLTWQKPDYTWPDADPPDRLNLVLPGELQWLDGEMILRLLAMGRTNYGLLPNIYSSFVRRDFIEAIRSKRGTFFASVTPDVYSAISLISEFRYFLFSPYPFSLAGASGSSNGMSNARPGGLAGFFSEASQPMHSGMPVIPGSISSCVLEALLTANDRVYDGRLRISRTRFLTLIVDELAQRVPQVRDEGFELLRRLDWSSSERRRLEKRIRQADTQPRESVEADAVDTASGRNNLISIRDCSKLGVRDVQSAAACVSDLVGPFVQPDSVPRLSWRGLGRELVMRSLARVAYGSSGIRTPPSILQV